MWAFNSETTSHDSIRYLNELLKFNINLASSQEVSEGNQKEFICVKCNVSNHYQIHTQGLTETWINSAVMY